MGKFDGILLCSDLDGTLLGPTGAISEENLAAIRYFQHEGGIFTFVTGRMPCFVEHIYRLVRPNAPFGCINGGGIYDHREGKYLWTEELPAAAIGLARRALEAFPQVGLQANTFERIYFCRENAVMEGFRRVTGVPNCPKPLDEVDEPMAKLVFGEADPTAMMRLQSFLAEQPEAEALSFVHSAKMLYEVLPKGVSKGTLLQRLGELLAIDPRRTVAVGDFYNDVPMLRTAGLGIAVANACAEAKEAADTVTVSYEQHAIAAVINGLASGNLSLY